MSEKNELVSNRRAGFNYEILESFEAGIMLQGTEIKSLREHGGNLQDAFVKIIDEEAWLVACHIAPYRFGNIYNHEERRDRKLLLHKREIAQLEEATTLRGYTIVPLSMYLKNGRLKVRIAIGKGKKTHDKRQAVKERDEKREIDKMRKMQR
jgi:SsrA-binding protein